MTTTLATTPCACSGTACTWITHARLGERCRNAFEGLATPPAWENLTSLGLCCPGCVVIHGFRDAAPLPPIRWSKRRSAYSDGIRENVR